MLLPVEQAAFHLKEEKTPQTNRATTMHTKRYVFIVLSCIVVMLLQGCAFFRLSREIKEMDQIRVVSGSIHNRSNMAKNVFIVLLEKKKAGWAIVRSTIIGPGLDKFAIESGFGVYYLFAFEDLNDNLSHDDNEPIGCYGQPSEIRIEASSTAVTLLGMDISLHPKSTDYGVIPDKLTLSPENLSHSFIKIGQVASFDDPIMAPENGVTGYWEPLSFVRKIGFCLLFQKTYDPRKVPVLFVHGALGTPLGWKNLVDQLDQDRFQPWFFYYPSGIPLEKSAIALDLMVMDLYRRYGFQEMHVVAHSMGGLVARSFILRNYFQSQQTFIKTFISISSPWNGHKLTAKGVERAPEAIPSWHDMVPDSAFIQALFKQDFPPSLNYYLMFSYKGDCSVFLANNDGTVELSSELDRRAQKEAKKIFGYNEDHGSILTDTQVLGQINSLIRQ